MTNVLKEMNLLEKYSSLAGMNLDEGEPEGIDDSGEMDLDNSENEFKLNKVHKAVGNAHSNTDMNPIMKDNKIVGKTPGTSFMNAIYIPKNDDNKQKSEEIENILIHFMEIIYKDQLKRGLLKDGRMIPAKAKENSKELAHNIALINENVKYRLYIYPNPRYVKDEAEALEQNCFFEPKYVFYLSYLDKGTRIKAIGDEVFIQSSYRNEDLGKEDSYYEYVSLGPNPYIVRLDNCLWAINSDTNFYVIKSSIVDTKNSLINQIESANYSELYRNRIYIMFSGPSLANLARELIISESLIREDMKPQEQNDDYSPFIPDVRGGAIWKERETDKDKSLNVQYNYDNIVFNAIKRVLQEKFQVSPDKIEMKADKIQEYMDQDQSFKVKHINDEYGSNKNYDIMWYLPKIDDNLEFWSYSPGLNNKSLLPGRDFPEAGSYTFDEIDNLVSSSGKFLRLTEETVVLRTLFVIIRDKFQDAVKRTEDLLRKNVKIPVWNENDCATTAILTLLINGISYNYKPRISYLRTNNVYIYIFKLFGDCSKIYVVDDDGKPKWYNTTVKDGVFYTSKGAYVDYEIDHINGMHFNDYRNLRVVTKNFNSGYWANKFGKVYFDINLTNPNKPENVTWRLEYDNSLKLIVPVGYADKKMAYTYANGYSGKSGQFTIQIYGRTAPGGANECVEGSTSKNKTREILVKDLMELYNEENGLKFLFITENDLVGRFSKRIGNTFTPITADDLPEIMSGASPIANFSRKVNNINDSQLDSFLNERYGRILNNTYFGKIDYDGKSDEIEAGDEVQTEQIHRGLDFLMEEDSSDGGKSNEYVMNTLVKRIATEADDLTEVSAYSAAEKLKNILLEEIMDENMTARVEGKPCGIFVDIGSRTKASNKLFDAIMKDPESWRTGYYFSTKGTGTKKHVSFSLIPSQEKGALCISVTGKLGNLSPRNKMTIVKSSQYGTAYPKTTFSGYENELIDPQTATPIYGKVSDVYKNSIVRAGSASPSCLNHIFSASNWKMEEFQNKFAKLGNEKGAFLFVHHINGVQSDFRPDNLTWIDNTDNTRFENANSLAIFRITPGSGEEVPVMVWQTFNDFEAYSKKYYDEENGTSFFDDKFDSGVFYTLTWDFNNVKNMLNKASYTDSFPGNQNFSYIFRRVLLRDTERVNILSIFNDENKEMANKAYIELVVGKEKTVNGKKMYVNIDDPTFIWESDIMKCHPYEIMTYYMRGTISSDRYEQVPELTDFIYDNFEKTPLMKKIGEMDPYDVESKIKLLDGICVSSMFPEHQKAIWGEALYESEEVRNGLFNAVSSGRANPDIMPSYFIPYYAEKKKKLKSPNWDIDSENAKKYIDRIIDTARTRHYAKKKELTRGGNKNLLYQQALERARKRIK